MIKTSGNTTTHVAKFFIQVVLHRDRFRAPEDNSRDA
jgi:hypothetical protein